MRAAGVSFKIDVMVIVMMMVMVMVMVMTPTITQVSATRCRTAAAAGLQVGKFKGGRHVFGIRGTKLLQRSSSSSPLCTCCLHTTPPHRHTPALQDGV